jgi:hypothetical protein
MPFEVKGEELLGDAIKVRVTTTEKKRLREDAELAGLTVSELVRRRSFGRPILAKTDLATTRELRRLGGLLKHLYNQSNGANSKESAAALRALTAYLEKLAR